MYETIILAEDCCCMGLDSLSVDTKAGFGGETLNKK